MAHYAFIDENNTVTEVITGKDESEGDLDWEQHYAEFRPGQRCLRTSYNTAGGRHNKGGTPFRKNYAGIGFTYDETRDAFIPPKTFKSWILNEDTCLWDPPEPYPEGKGLYLWDEANTKWLTIETPTAQ
jgi:hypothetical protein